MNTWKNLLCDTIAFGTTNGLIMTNYQDIIYISADGSYSNIHTLEHPEFIVSSNLGCLEELLPETLFIRIHHKYLVNKLHVRKLLTNGKCEVILSNGTQLEVSLRKKKTVVNGFIKLL